MESSQYHPDWQNSRISFMDGLYSPEFFHEKTILELGAFNGYIGNHYAQTYGSKVTCVEGRQGNADEIKKNYPLVNVICADLDTPNWDFGHYDIIINYGLCYHLQNYHREHLLNCMNHCDFMFFESVIFDSFDSEIYFNSENGGDQSLSGVGGTPSTSFVENIFREHGSKFKKYCDARIGNKYDWPDGDTKKHQAFYRRFWTVDVTGKNHSLVNEDYESSVSVLAFWDAIVSQQAKNLREATGRS